MKKHIFTIPCLIIVSVSTIQGDFKEDLQYQQQLNALNTISHSINDLSFQSSLNAISSNIATMLSGAGIANAQAAQTMMQERWNQWNGLVSLLNTEQKQTVLKFNTTPENELVKMWKETRKQKGRFPLEWLTPVKQESFQSAALFHVTTELSPEEYLEFVKDLDIKSRKSLWFKTHKDLKRQIVLQMKERKKTFQIDSIDEYRYWRNYYGGYWEDTFLDGLWKDYNKAKMKYLSRNK